MNAPNPQKENLILANFEKFLDRLLEFPFEKTVSEFERDGAIQRFEIVFEQAWKTFKFFLAKQGVEANSPKSSISGAYQQNWIEDENVWLNIMSDRNLTSHTYHEELSKEIYNRIRGYVPVFSSALESLKKGLYGDLCGSILRPPQWKRMAVL